MEKIKEEIKPKRPAVIHNLVKIKTLLFLSMRKQTENRAATARQIAIATGGNADSLYVLLQRWRAWGLVGCIPAEPYMYWIAPEGERYLSKIDNWFFSGYYSKKRKKRIRGYRGKVEDLKREIAIASKARFWWRYTADRWGREDEGDKGVAYYMKAPFEAATDLVKIEGSEGRGITWNDKSYLLIVRFKSAHQAYQFLPEWGCRQKTRDLGQAIVDANIGMVWRQDAQ